MARGQRYTAMPPCPFSCLQAVEVAMQQLMLDQPAAAIEGFEAALKLDELNMKAALGLIEAYLAAGQLDEAAQQLQFLPELLAASRAAGTLSVDALAAASGRSMFGFGGSSCRVALSPAAVRRRSSRMSADDSQGNNLQLVAGRMSEVDQVQQEEPLLLYLRGMLAWKQGRQQDGLQQLTQFMELQLNSVEDLPYGLGLFELLHASRILWLLRMLLDSAGGDPRQPTDPPSPMLANCIRSAGGNILLADTADDLNLKQ